MLAKTCHKQPNVHECECWSLVIAHHRQRRPSQRTKGDPPAGVYALVTRIKRKAALVTFDSTLAWACILPRCINRDPQIPYVHVPVEWGVAIGSCTMARGQQRPHSQSAPRDTFSSTARLCIQEVKYPYQFACLRARPGSALNRVRECKTLFG